MNACFLKWTHCLALILLPSFLLVNAATETPQATDYYAPAHSFDGIWSLAAESNKDDIQGNFLNFLFETRIIHRSGEQTAQGDIVLASPDLLGSALDKQSFKLLRITSSENKPQLTIAFQTSKGHYTALLNYVPIFFDERSEGWHGMLYLAKQAVAYVRFSKSETARLAHAYQGEYSIEENRAIGLADQQNSQPVGKMQANWVLYNQDAPLMRLQIIHNKGSHLGIGSFVTIGSGGDLLNSQISSGDLSFTLDDEQTISLFLNTAKDKYEITLTDSLDKLIRQDWINTSLGENDLVWLGELRSNATAPLMPVILIKLSEPKNNPENTSNRYDLKANRTQLIHTCHQAICSYDHIETGLKNIPLLKDWAIETPYYYATAGGVLASKPTIVFVNTKNRLWLSLNQRMLVGDWVTCHRLGRKGRLSEENEICIINETIAYDETTGDAATLIENIEFWLEATYGSPYNQ